MDEAPHTKQVGMLRALRQLGRYRSPPSQLVSPLLLQPSYGQSTLERRAILNLNSSTILPHCHLNFPRELVKNPLDKTARANTWHPPSPPGFYDGAGPVDSRMINRAGKFIL